MKTITRRKFIGSLALGASALMIGACASSGVSSRKKVKFGVITDIHKGLQTDAEQRLKTFIDAANREKPDFIIQLGDMTHGKPADVQTMLTIWNKFEGPSFHVLGNHDMDMATKEDIIKAQNMPNNYYSFDVNGTHFVVLDFNYILQDGEYKDYAHGNYYIDKEHRDLINEEQLHWLAADLAATDKPVILFSHQGIGDMWGTSGVPNKNEIRNVINNARKNGKNIIACFSGHHHVDYCEKNDGVYYYLINSASYYYCEKPNYSNKHLAEYKDPLYAFVSLDYNNDTITVEGVESEFIPPAPSQEDMPDDKHISADIKNRTIKLR